MDRALKERIVGAVVLVVFAVLIVPVFLDGPAGDVEMMRESVSLPGQDDQERKRRTIVLERDRDEPVPNAAPAESAVTGAAGDDAAAADSAAAVPERVAAAPPAASTDTGETKPRNGSAEAESGAQPAPAAEEDAAAGSSTGMWAVQLGSFSNPDNAERLAGKLRSDGYAAFLSEVEAPSGRLHRVRIGPQEDRDSALRVAARLAEDGHDGQVVPHP